MASALASNTSLNSLDLHGNSIRDEGLKSLCKCLSSSNHTLTNLCVSKNNITTEGATVITALLLDSISLRRLDISQNQFAVLETMVERATSKGIELVSNSVEESDSTTFSLY